MFVADCCKTLVAIQHSEMSPTVCLIPGDTAVVKCKDGLSHKKVIMRMWTRSFDKKRDPNAPDMPPYEGSGNQVKDLGLMAMFEPNAGLMFK